MPVSSMWPIGPLVRHTMVDQFLSRNSWDPVDKELIMRFLSVLKALTTAIEDQILPKNIFFLEDALRSMAYKLRDISNYIDF